MNVLSSQILNITRDDSYFSFSHLVYCNVHPVYVHTYDVHIYGI